MKIRVNVRLTPEAVEILDRYAQANGLSRTAAVELAARLLPKPTEQAER